MYVSKADVSSWLAFINIREVENESLTPQSEEDNPSSSTPSPNNCDNNSLTGRGESSAEETPRTEK